MQLRAFTSISVKIVAIETPQTVTEPLGAVAPSLPPPEHSTPLHPTPAAAPKAPIEPEDDAVTRACYCCVMVMFAHTRTQS